MEPFLLVLSGLPGSGKTTLCAALEERIAIAILSTDRIRYEMFPVRRYTREESVEVYGAVARRACKLLRAGTNVVVDGTNLLPRYISSLDWHALAAETGATLVGLHLEVSESVLHHRLDGRQACSKDNKSEATVNTLARFAGTHPPKFAIAIKADIFAPEELASTLVPFLRTCHSLVY